MNIHKWLLSIAVFAILVLNIECCTSKSENPQTRAIITSTTPQMIEKLTTTEDFTETTTAFVTEIDFKTTTNEANDNGDLPTALPANFEILTTQCTEHHVKFICLNGGTCIRFQMPNEESLLTCKCSDGYLGERCENLDTSAKVIEINITVFNSGRQQQLDSNSSAAFQVPFAFLAVIISFIGFQMLSN